MRGGLYRAAGPVASGWVMWTKSPENAARVLRQSSAPLVKMQSDLCITDQATREDGENNQYSRTEQYRNSHRERNSS